MGKKKESLGADTSPPSSSSKFSRLFSDANPFRRKPAVPQPALSSSHLLHPNQQQQHKGFVHGIPQRQSEERRIRVSGREGEKKKKNKKEGIDAENNGVNDDEGKFGFAGSQVEKKMRRKEAENPGMVDEGVHFENDRGRKKMERWEEETRYSPHDQRNKITKNDGSREVRVAGIKADKKKVRAEAKKHEVKGLNGDEGHHENYKVKGHNDDEEMSNLAASQSKKKRKRNEAENPKMEHQGFHLETNHGAKNKKMKKEEASPQDERRKITNDGGSLHRVRVGENSEERKKEGKNYEVLAGNKAEKKRKRKEAENPKMLDGGLHLDNGHVEKKKKGKEEASRNGPHEVLKEDKVHHKQIKQATASAFSPQNEEGFGLGFDKNANGIKSEMKGEKVKRVKNLGRDSMALPHEIERESLRELGESSRIQTDAMTQNSKEGSVEARKENGVVHDEIVKHGKSHEDKLKRTIFVSNLPLHVKRKVLMREFSPYGKVESVRVRSIPLVDTKLPRKAAVITGHVNEARNSVNAYVVFKDHEAAKAALSHNMKEIYERHIRVDLAKAPHNNGEDSSSVKYDPTRSIFVGNLPFDAEDEELYHLFSSGNSLDLQVEGVRIVRDPLTSVGKGFAFVLFKTKAGVKFTFSRGTLHLRERELRLRKINASVYSKSHPKSRSGLNSVKISHRFRERESRLDQRFKKPLQESKEKSISRSVKPYEGFRSSLKEGKPSRWVSSSQSRVKYNLGKSPSQKPHTHDGSQLVARKKKRPAVAARKNPMLKKPKISSKDKSVKLGGARRQK